MYLLQIIHVYEDYKYDTDHSYYSYDAYDSYYLCHGYDSYLLYYAYDVYDPKDLNHR